MNRTRSAVAAGLALTVIAGCSSSTASSTMPTTSSIVASAIAAPTTTPKSASPSTASASPKTPTTATSTTRSPAAATADRRVSALTVDLGRGGVSVAAVDLDTGTRYSYGATGGMVEGSIAKLDILEVLLLQHQDAGTALPTNERELATSMIRRSDNDAANSLWEAEGEAAKVRPANVRLGVTDTVLGSGIYWGLSTTSAHDQLALLHDLVDHDSPLTAASRTIVLDLMRGVESDQRWGVGVAADRGTGFANKNGWLAVSSDDGRWLVNSLGVLTVGGHRVLMAVLTQHGPSFDAGITLTQQIARTVATALR